jgi:hypothetical protein
MADGVERQIVDAWFQTLHIGDVPTLSFDQAAQWVMQATVGQRIDLAGNGRVDVVELRLGDVLNMDQQRAIVTADAGDVLHIDQSGWQQTGVTTVVDSRTYVVWSQDSAFLLIDQQATVHLVL